VFTSPDVDPISGIRTPMTVISPIMVVNATIIRIAAVAIESVMSLGLYIYAAYSSII
jgi:hypothetical protein